MVHNVWDLYGEKVYHFHLEVVHLGYWYTPWIRAYLEKMRKGKRSYWGFVSSLPRAVQYGRHLGNALVPRGSRRARAVAAAGRTLKKWVSGGAKKRRASCGCAGAAKPRKRVRTSYKVKRKYPVYRGKMGPKFPRKPSNWGINRYQTHGYVIDYENGGTATDAQAVYVAHGMPNRTVVEAIAGALTRKAMSKFGLEIKGWEVGAITSNSADRFTWTIATQAGPTAGLTYTNSAVILGNQTTINLSIALANLFMAVVAVGSRYTEFVEIRCGWLNRPAATDDFREEYRVMLSDIDVYLMIKSTLTLQNRTLAVKSEETEVDQTNSLDIAHNPLIGRVYYGRGTHINMKSMDGGVANDFVSLSPLTGLDAVAASGASTTLGARKLPSWYDLTNVRGSSPTFLKAGEIRDSVIYFEKKYRFATLMQKMLDYMSTSTATVTGTDATEIYWPIKMFGFEKKIDTRTAGQPSVTVGYQINYQLGVRCVVTKRNAPLRVIST